MTDKEKNSGTTHPTSRLDAMLEEFLSKDILPAEAGITPPDVKESGAGSMSSPQASRSATLGPRSKQLVRGADRPAGTEAWDSDKSTGGSSFAGPSITQSRASRAAGRADKEFVSVRPLEKAVNSLVDTPESNPSGLKAVLAVAGLLVLVAGGVYLWKTSLEAFKIEPPTIPATTSIGIADPQMPLPLPIPQAPSGDSATAHPALMPANSQPSGGTSVEPVLKPPAPQLAPPANNVNRSLAERSEVPAKPASPSTQPKPNPPLEASPGRSSSPGNVGSNFSVPPGSDAPLSQGSALPAPLPIPKVSSRPAELTSPGRAPAAPQTATVTAATAILKVTPVYPELARRLKIAGTVDVDITVDFNGKVSEATATSGPSLLRGAAEMALKQWRFKPNVLNGKPVIGKGKITVVFHADQR
jgi:TonB family protein